MVEQVTTLEETKTFSCSVLDVQDDVIVNSQASFKRFS